MIDAIFRIADAVGDKYFWYVSIPLFFALVVVILLRFLTWLAAGLPEN